MWTGAARHAPRKSCGTTVVRTAVRAWHGPVNNGRVAAPREQGSHRGATALRAGQREVPGGRVASPNRHCFEAPAGEIDLTDDEVVGGNMVCEEQGDTLDRFRQLEMAARLAPHVQQQVSLRHAA